MRDKEHPGSKARPDLLVGIAPVFRVDPDTGEAHLIGTGFWATTVGHLITAWHVVAENIGSKGADRGPIFAIQTFPDRSIAVRNFVKTDRHPVFDLALSETIAAPPQPSQATYPLTMALDDVRVGDPVFSFAVLASDCNFDLEKWPGETIARFSGTLLSKTLPQSATVQFAVRQSFGYVSQVFETMRDRVMLPFPCIQTDVPIYGANSGGPLFDAQGRVCAVHCTSYEGADIAFHVPIQGILQLRLRAQSVDIADPARNQFSIGELAAAGKIPFDPPMLDIRTPLRSVLRWVVYAGKRVIRGRLPSKGLHFAVGENRLR